MATLSMSDYLRQTNQSYRQALDSLSYKRLQQEAKDVGVKANGKREELVARLYAKYLETLEANRAAASPECDSSPSSPIPAEAPNAQDSALIAPAHKCAHCSKPMEWDAPSGVCSTECLRAAQGFAPAACVQVDVYESSPAELESRESWEGGDGADDWLPVVVESPSAPFGWDSTATPRRVEDRADELADSIACTVITAADDVRGERWFGVAMATVLRQWRDFDAPALLLACERITGRRIECRYAAENALGAWAHDEFVECIALADDGAS